MHERVREYLSDVNPEAMMADGLEEACVGVMMRFGQSPVALYDYDKCIEVFMKEGSSEEEAIEHFEFNVMGAWVGDGTPAFMKVIVPDEMLTFVREMFETAGVKK
jgi:hypothetical protein